MKRIMLLLSFAAINIMASELEESRFRELLHEGKAVFSPDKKAAIVSMIGEVQAQTGSILFKNDKIISKINALAGREEAFSPNSKYAYMPAEYGEYGKKGESDRVYDLDTRTFKEYPRALRHHFSPDSNKLLINPSEGNELLVYDLASGQLLHSIPALPLWSDSPSFSPDSNKIAYAGGGKLHIYNMMNGTEQVVDVAHLQSGRAVDVRIHFLSDKQLMITVKGPEPEPSETTSTATTYEKYKMEKINVL
jgi:WD40 repeat protein